MNNALLYIYSNNFFLLQIQDKQKKVVAATNDLEEFDDRIHAMSEHLKNVRQELQHTQVFS